MKRCTQSDLRKMYETPPRELSEQIHETISSLPVREQEEKIVKKIYTSAEQLIGNTPLLELTRVEKEFSLKAFSIGSKSCPPYSSRKKDNKNCNISI